MKRPPDDQDSKTRDPSEPSMKIPHLTADNLTQFSVEIVQQLEFSTSGNQQAQQISSNVTVKTHVKTDDVPVVNQTQGNPNGGGDNKIHLQQHTSHSNHQEHRSHSNQDLLGNIVDFKQEPDNDFADLEQCAAALEKDVAAAGHFPGLSDLIGDNTNDQSDTFKDLISDLDIHADLLAFTGDYEPMVDIKQEDLKDLKDSELLNPNSNNHMHGLHGLNNMGGMKTNNVMDQHQTHSNHQQILMQQQNHAQMTQLHQQSQMRQTQMSQHQQNLNHMHQNQQINPRQIHTMQSQQMQMSHQHHAHQQINMPQVRGYQVLTIFCPSLRWESQM